VSERRDEIISTLK
jgi:cobalamin biosynthesis protein CobT